MTIKEKLMISINDSMMLLNILHLCQFPKAMGNVLGPIPSCSQSFSLSLCLRLRPSLRTLFPFDHIPAKTCSAIYSRVVLFYPPASICSTVKCRGLPACWRQQCRAAVGWLECERGEGKRQADRGKLNDTKGGVGLKDVWHKANG